MVEIFSEKVHISVTRWQDIDLCQSRAPYISFTADRLAFCPQLRPYHRKLKVIRCIHSVCSHICVRGIFQYAVVVFITHATLRNLVLILFVRAYMKMLKKFICVHPLHTIHQFDNINYVVWCLMGAL
jgi:hypothetical protein